MRLQNIGPDPLVRVSRIECRVEPYDWRFATEEAARIDAHWATQCRLKPALFDGRVLLAHRLAVERESLVGACFETSFKSFLSWRDFGFPGALIANCFGMSALRAADGAFLLGEMSSHTANAGRLYFPAGTPEPSDADTDGYVDLEANILRELEEETGITSREVTLDHDWTIVRDGPRVACFKIVQSIETAASLQARLSDFNAAQDEPELVRLVSVASASDLDEGRMPTFMLRYLRAMLEA